MMDSTTVKTVTEERFAPYRLARTSVGLNPLMNLGCTSDRRRRGRLRDAGKEDQEERRGEGEDLSAYVDCLISVTYGADDDLAVHTMTARSNHQEASLLGSSSVLLTLSCSFPRQKGV